MQDQLNDMLRTFGSYSLAFNTLEPIKVEPFFHSPSMLMTSEQVVVMHKIEEILEVFKALMESLKLKNYKESKIIDELKVTQLSDNQVLVVLPNVLTRITKKSNILVLPIPYEKLEMN